MSAPRSWTKMEDNSYTEGWRNQYTSEIVMLEKSDGENEVYTMFRHPALDGEHIGVFSNQEEAFDAAQDYMNDNTSVPVSEKPGTNQHIADGFINADMAELMSEEDFSVTTENGEWINFTLSTFHLLEWYGKHTDQAHMIKGMIEEYAEQEATSELRAAKYIVEEGQFDNTFNTEDGIQLTRSMEYALCSFASGGSIEPVNEIYDADFIVALVHRGTGDIRGSYGEAIVLEIDVFEETEIISALHDVHAETKDEDGDIIQWYSDDQGYHWYDGDGEGDANWEVREDDTVIYKPSGNPIEFSNRIESR